MGERRKLDPQTADEINECSTIEGMRARLHRYSHENAMVRAVLMSAALRGLSGDDTMTWLAFEALRRVERLEELLLEDAMAQTMPPLMPVDTTKK